MQPQIFISYSWRNKDIVDTIDADWEAVGIKLIRDIRDLEYKQNIKDFMKRVNDSDYVLLIISKGYLESKSCMYEAIEMFESSSFKDRILPILVEDARIDKSHERLNYIQYWEEEIEKLNSSIKNLKSHANAIGIYKELDHYTKIRSSIDRFMDEISSILCLPWDEAKQTSYAPLFKAIGVDRDNILAKCIKINSLASVEEKELALDELFSRYPNNKHVLNAQASLAHDEKKHKKEKRINEKIIELYPDYFYAYNHLANLLAYNFKEHEKAKGYYKKALEINPKFASAYNNLGLLYKTISKTTGG